MDGWMDTTKFAMNHSWLTDLPPVVKSSIKPPEISKVTIGQQSQSIKHLRQYSAVRWTTPKCVPNKQDDWHLY